MANIRLVVIAPVVLALSVLLGACSSTGSVADVSSTTTGAVDPIRGGGTVPQEGSRLDQWTVGTARPAIDTNYSLNNKARGAVLFSQPGMPNGLNWDGYSHNEWSFQKSPSSQFLAIYNKQAQKYLVADSTVVGWTSLPTYEWSWVATADNRIALRNVVREDYLISDVYSVPFGQVNWKFHPVSVPITHDATVTMNGQPPVQGGYKPFLGYYGGGPSNTNVLIEVRNPQQHNTPLFFVKPGYSSNQCGQTGATLYLEPGAALTAAEMTLLWGSPEPSLNTKRSFLACAATNNNSVFVNVKYHGS